MNTNKMKHLSPLVTQQILRKLGMYCSEKLLIDIHYLIEALSLAVWDVGEDWLREEMKKEDINWDEKKEKLEKIKNRVRRAKNFYDCLKDKTLEKKTPSEIEMKINSNFKKNIKKIALIEDETYEVFMFIVNHTDLKQQKIPSDAFKILEHHHFQKTDLTRRSSPQFDDNIVRVGEQP